MTAVAPSQTMSNGFRSSVCFQKDQRAHLTVDAASCTVFPEAWQFGRSPKKILDDISFDVRSSDVLAVMGPSGAGKTTLLSLVTLENGPGVASGDIRLNGCKMTASLFRKHCVLVAQQDFHWPFLTCRESMQYMADFCLSLQREEREAIVNEMIEKMGLKSCENTRVGNHLVSGLSGGEKRRLSIATAMMKSPLVIFLDEPTSGLDAAAAASIMKFLKTMAVECNVAVVCTIHQPASSVFAGFDQTLVLSAGRVAYCGTAKAVPFYFESIGFSVPVNTNPADFMLDLCNRAFTATEIVDAVMDAWARQPRPNFVMAPETAQAALLSKSEYGTTFGQQLWTSLERNVVLLLRDPTLYVGRIFMFVISCGFFAFVYERSAERTQEQAMNRLWLLNWCVGVPANLGVVAVFTNNVEFHAVKKETKLGTYHPMVHLVTQNLLQLPMMFVLAASAITLPGYMIGNWDIEGYPRMLVVFAGVLWCFEGLAQLLSVAFVDPLLGMLSFTMLWFACFLFNGFLIREDHVAMPLRLLFNVSPLKWTTNSVAYIEFEGTTFQGAVPADNGPGFLCPGISDPRACMGYTGSQVLRSLNVLFEIVQDEDHFGRNILYLCLIALVCKLVHAIIFLLKASSCRVIKEKLHEPTIVEPDVEACVSDVPRAV
eukprot:TRINITY_DN51308_c0_g2_i1.p1 TRINITY_DN51308_c0_g2~~TRINITY_DN51308_c0_g2_i1.p1  ORF type:complete len:656 (+),score=104.14 TRINITY_DN51308_c0_g2_i1:25-1992(+)